MKFKLPNIKAYANSIQHLAQTNAPIIFAGVGIAGVVGTAILSGRASIKAYQIYQEEGKKTPKETIKSYLPIFLPPLVMGGITISSIVFSYRSHEKQLAAMFALYKASDKYLDEYKSSVTKLLEDGKTITPDKVEELTSDQVWQRELDDAEKRLVPVIDTGHGSDLCFDAICGRYFHSNAEFIRQQVNDLNDSMLGGYDWTSLNRFYDAIGLPMTGVGEYMGWESSRGVIRLKFGSKLHPRQNIPVLVVDFEDLVHSLTDKYTYD